MSTDGKRAQNAAQPQIDKIDPDPPSGPSACVRVLSVSRSCTGIATVVLELISKDRVGGRPSTKARVEYNYFTEETKPVVIGAKAREMVLARYVKALAI